MIQDFFNVSIDTAVAPDQGNDNTMMAKKHDKTYRTRQGRKNRAYRTGEQAVLPLDDECTPRKNPGTRRKTR
ncbi:MAG: hypothetical protein ACTSRA_09890 [Promethearchaeota archaeon]